MYTASGVRIFKKLTIITQWQSNGQQSMREALGTTDELGQIVGHLTGRSDSPSALDQIRGPARATLEAAQSSEEYEV